MNTARLYVALTLMVVCAACNKPQPRAQVAELPNGIRVVAVHFPGRTNVSIFTCAPMGLASDDAGHAQWAHLVEHLVIRSTVPNDLTHANAETLADHMRLDTYGTVADWQNGLSHHRRWLEGIPFTETSLQTEKPRVVSECDFTARNFATHKFALAAWAHGARHGQTHVAIKGDVLNAALADVQALRDEHFAIPGQITVCVAGGVEPATVMAVLKEELGNIKLTGKPVPAVKTRSGKMDLTWDLEARHLLLTWKIPGFEDSNYAGLMVAAQLLSMEFASSPKLKQQVGMALAGTDLLTPEGNFFYISASLKPGASFEEVGRQLQATLDRLAAGQDLDQATGFGKQLAFSMRQVADPSAFMSSLPPGMTPAMLEGNLGLMFGLNVHRYGAKREALAQNLSAATPASARQAIQKHLSGAACSICTIQPKQN
jgi:predicted Zn-dependent peptidase